MLAGKKLKACLLRLAKGHLNIQCHVKLRKNNAATEKVQGFSLIKQNTMSKNLTINLAPEK